MTTLRNSCSKIFNRVTIFLESTWWKYLFKIIPYLFLEQRSNNLSGSGRRRQRGHRFRSRSFRWHSKSSFRFHLSLCSHNHFQVFFLSFGLLQSRGRIKSILLYNNKQACFPQYCRWKLFCLLFQFWMTHWRTLNIGGSITVWLVSKSTGPYSTKQENMFLNNGPTLASFCSFLVFSNKQYNFYNKSMWKMSMQYMALGFEPKTFRTWVVTHNH